MSSAKVIEEHPIDLSTIEMDLGTSATNKRVVVAMSGGVDSSVAAALMVEMGYDVIGITMQLYDQGEVVQGQKTCCAGADILDARLVASKLDIPHYVLNYENKFKQGVIDQFVESYIEGETPIPCVKCNQTVKFKDMLEMSKSLGAAALVTGHYIEAKPIRVETKKKRALFRPTDDGRDQSYFLFATTQEQLDYLRFPLGGLEKAKVRDYAKRMGLSIADKPDSQDICFVPDGDYSKIIAKYRPDAFIEGEIHHIDGRVLGTHQGIINFTIGQRRGLGIAVGEPLFVVKLDPRSAKVIVGPEEALQTTRIWLEDINWLGDIALQDAARAKLDIAVKIRSTTPPKPARLGAESGSFFVDLLAPEKGVSAGQACVFYESEQPLSRVFGGGWITASKLNENGS